MLQNYISMDYESNKVSILSSFYDPSLSMENTPLGIPLSHWATEPWGISSPENHQEIHQPGSTIVIILLWFSPSYSTKKNTIVRLIKHHETY